MIFRYNTGVMFYRKKFILSLLDTFGGELEKLRLQKLLFLFTQQQQKRVYDFIPYKFGCFSYSANADIAAMQRQNLLLETEQEIKRAAENMSDVSLTEQDKRILFGIKRDFGEMTTDNLISYTYRKYPYWAINSKRNLLPEEKKLIDKERPCRSDTVLFTIGYEGISLEEYLNRLIRNDVKILADVRNNPLSMKYGFNKGQLQRYCENSHIKYVHFPRVGIRSEKRKELHTQSDYDRLFTEYRKTVLTETGAEQQEIISLLRTEQRVALTCFEADINKCHRKQLAEKLAGDLYKVEHI